MIQQTICPICQSVRRHLLKTYLFSFPDFLSWDMLPQDVNYEDERLWIFFKAVLGNREPVKIDVILCQECGLIFTTPRMTPEDIQAKYQMVDTLQSARMRQQQQPAQNTDRRAKRIYSLLKKYSGASLTSQRILDYGGAQGYNLSPFLKAGNECSLVDYVQYEYPAGIRYVGRDLTALAPDEKFDIIVCCHTLEHVIDPVALISQLLNFLARDGLLYVEVPLGCWKEWEWLAEPLTHVNFFSEQSLAQCIERAGLYVTYLSTAYQWLIHENGWCINLIGSHTQPKGADIHPRTTQQQMTNLFYLSRRMLDHPRFYANILTRKVLSLNTPRKADDGNKS